MCELWLRRTLVGGYDWTHIVSQQFAGGQSKSVSSKIDQTVYTVAAPTHIVFCLGEKDLHDLSEASNYGNEIGLGSFCGGIAANAICTLASSYSVLSTTSVIGFSATAVACLILFLYFAYEGAKKWARSKIAMSKIYSRIELKDRSRLEVEDKIVDPKSIKWYKPWTYAG